MKAGEASPGKRELILQPDIHDEIAAAVEQKLGHRPVTARRPVIVVERTEIRQLFWRYFVRPRFAGCAVLSLTELSPDVELLPLGYIAPGGGERI